MALARGLTGTASGYWAHLAWTEVLYGDPAPDDVRQILSRAAGGAEAPEVVPRFRAAAEKLDAEIKARAPEGGVNVFRRSNNPPLTPDRSSAAETLARALTGDNDTRAASYAAEAGLFQRAGWPCVLCGPGSITQAHQPDEWIELSQIEEGARFMARLVEKLIA